MTILIEILKSIPALILGIACYGVLFAISPWLALAVFVGGSMLLVAEDNAAGNSTENGEK